jgi:hypothetical protein
MHRCSCLARSQQILRREAGRWKDDYDSPGEIIVQTLGFKVENVLFLFFFIASVTDATSLHGMSCFGGTFILGKTDSVGTARSLKWEASTRLRRRSVPGFDLA